MSGQVDDARVEDALRSVSAELIPRAAEFGESMAVLIERSVPFYRESGIVTHQQLVQSCADNLRYVLGGLTGTAIISPDVPRAVGRERAEQGVSYAAVLKAYRVGGRYIWELLVEHASDDTRDVLLRAAADIWAVTDELQGEVTDAYRAALVDRARQDTQIRAAHLATLLDGDSEVVEQLLESVSVLDLPRDAEYVVVTAQSKSPGQEALPRIDARLRARNVSSAWRLEHDMHDGIVALRKGFGLDDLETLLREGAEGRAGISEPFDRIVAAPDARRQSRTAARAATPGTTEIVRYGSDPLGVLVASAPEVAAVMVQQVLGPVLDLREEDREVLLETARVWIGVAGSTSAAAEQMHIHRNTVSYRLRRFQEVSGRDLAKPREAAEAHLALEAVRVLGLA